VVAQARKRNARAGSPAFTRCDKRCRTTSAGRYPPPPRPAAGASVDVPVNTQNSNIDAIRLALEYGDKNSQLVARAYADAYKVAGTSWAAVVQPLAQALSALSSRVVTLESRLEELPGYDTVQPEPEPKEPSPLDQLAEGVLAGVVQGAMNAGPPKP